MRKNLYYTLLLILLMALFLITIWEHWIQELVFSIIKADYEPEDHMQRVECIITSLVFTLIALIVSSKIIRGTTDERDRAVEALRQSEERYRLLVENAPDSIALFCEDKLVYANPATVHLLGAVSKEEIINRHVFDIMHPDFHQAALERMRQVLEEGETAPLFEQKLIRLDGKEIEAEVVGTPTVYGGKPAIQTFARDITERKWAEEALKTSEEKYRTLFEESRDGIFIVTREGNFIDINQSALDLFGYTKDEILGMNARELYVYPVERYRPGQEIERKGFVRDYKLKFRKKDGAEMDCLITSTRWGANNGTMLGYQGIIRDITEKRKMEEELLRVEKLESIGILAGGIAHDFNNILTAILGNISLTKMFANTENPILEGLEDAEKAALRGKGLTQQLLTFSKGGAPIKKIVDIAELMKESVSFALRGSNVRCEFSIPDNLWLVEADEGQISQVINNLIINADQAMPEGGIITVRSENITGEARGTLSLEDGDYIKISIEDRGIGISEEYIPKIFDPYFTTKAKGSGLGLATTYSIIKGHGGYITVDSKFGVGTTFHIYLPASKEKILPRKEREERLIVGKGKVLMMDDDGLVREGARRMLNYIGYGVEFAIDGAQAIELYRRAKESEQPFAAVIMDLTVPGCMGGKEAIRKLHEIDPKVKAVVSSGYSDDPVIIDFKQYGFSAVLAKPYEIQELSKTLHTVIMG
jgi:PAS domain S-box-containing protein